MIPNLIVSVSALPKTGKNHFAYSSPEPIVVYCFNGGAEWVAKNKFLDKDITIKNYTLPIVESTDQKWASPVWDKFYSEYKKDIVGGKYATYILDTATEIENTCQQAVLEEQQESAELRDRTKQKLATTEFLARNLRMKALFDSAKNAGVNLISLQYLKEEWIKERGKDRAEPTGKLVLDGWRRTETQADINLEMMLINKGGKSVTKTTIATSRFDRDLNGTVLEDTTFEEVVALLLGE